MPTIRVEEEVFQGLRKIAEPFTDTPNSVIRRLLEEKGIIAKPKPRSSEPERTEGHGNADGGPSVRVPPSSLTPQSVYESYLLYVLRTQFNGRGGKHEVSKAVIDLMKTRGFIGPADLVRVKTGETKAENTIAWGRNALKERGLVSRQSPRGEWELTPEGMEQSKRIILPRSRKEKD